MGRGGERGLHVSRLLQQLRRDVAGDVVVDEVLGGRGRFRCDHNRQRLVLDLDQVGRILGDISVLRNHESDGLADVTNYLRSQAALCAAVGEIGMRDEDGEVGVAERQVVREIDRFHAWQRKRRAHVDRLDGRMGERRPNDARLQRALVDVIGEVAAPAQEPVVFDALHPGAEPAGGHRFESSDARMTARRIDA